MANPQNLKTPSATEARERGRKGGIVSQQRKKERKTIRMVLEELLAEKQDNGATKLEILTAKCLKGAYERGDVKDLKTIAELLGESMTNISVQIPTISVLSKEERDKLKEIADASN